MTHSEDLLAHPPTMAEMVGGVLDAEEHPSTVTPHVAVDDVASGLAALEAETEQ